MYYLRSRYYSPNWMRFLNADSIIRDNLYQYCSDNPLLNIDPSGLDTLRFENSDPEDDFVDPLQGGGFSEAPTSSELQRVFITPASAHNPHGRLGGPLHQEEVQSILAKLDPSLKARGEFRVRTPGGAKEMRFLDVGYTSNGILFGYQVVVYNKNGKPVAREIHAIDDIMNHSIYTNVCITFVGYKTR